MNFSFKVVTSIITVFVIVGAVVAFLLLGPSGWNIFGSSQSGGSSQLIFPTPAPVGNNPIQRENSLPGSISWKIPQGNVSTIQIQGYAGATSVTPGKTINFYVSTQQGGTHYRIEFYRLGWYSGLGGRFLLSSGDLSGQSQGIYNFQSTTSGQLQGCTCTMNTITGVLEAGWRSSYTLNVPATWATGIYLAKFVDANNFQSYAPFVVPGNATSPYIASTPDTTMAALNQWGGASFTSMDSATTGLGISATALNPRKTGVVRASLDRPYVLESGASQILGNVLQMVHWMEQKGYDVSYASDVDIQTNPGMLLQHKAYIAMGSNEYWTRPMYDGLQKAVDTGVGIAFMGAHNGFWQMRFETDKAGVQNRTIFCSQSQSGFNTPLNNSYANDNQYHGVGSIFAPVDNSLVTTSWNDPLLHRPEQSLVGVAFADATHQVVAYPWVVSTAENANSLLLKGTGIKPGNTYGNCALTSSSAGTLVGSEWDSVSLQYPRPAGLHTIGDTRQIQNDQGRHSISNTTYYIGNGHAMVFATGSTYWVDALDNYRDPLIATQLAKACGLTAAQATIPELQALMSNVMQDLVQHYPVAS